MTAIHPDKTSSQHEARVRLRRVLKRADYATSDMHPSNGIDSHEEVMIIRRIHEATILPAHYPKSRRRKLNANPAALASWENEGGAVCNAKTQ